MHVCTLNIQYVCHIYLYSTACLYNKSSDGVNLFCSSSSIWGRNPPSNASVCDILLPVVAAGTGSLLSNVCRLSKQDFSWPSKPLINLLMASSVSAASGLASKNSPSSGQGLPPSSSSLAQEGCGISLRTASLCLPRKPGGIIGYIQYVLRLTMYVPSTYIACTLSNLVYTSTDSVYTMYIHSIYMHTLFTYLYIYCSQMLLKVFCYYHTSLCIHCTYWSEPPM